LLPINQGDKNITLPVKKLNIICPVYCFQEPLIKKIVNKINRVDGLAKKAVFVEELQSEVNILLSCPNYFVKKTECKDCHFIAKLRKKTAEIIIKTQKLA
jgi:hypothetical protein